MARPYKPIPRLSEELRIRYLDLKAKIQEDIRIGTEAFKRAGEHLLMIRQERLYREEYSTFEAFCRDVFGHSKTYAKQPHHRGSKASTGQSAHGQSQWINR